MLSSRSILMLKITAIAALAVSVTVTAAPAQPTPIVYAARQLTPTQVSADVELMRQALEQVHAGYDRYVPRRVMDTAFARLGRRAATPMTDLELYREVALLLARIRCNHTKAEYPAALESFRTKTATHLPVRVRVFDKRMFVDTSAGNAIAHGTEIVSINGKATKDIVERLSRFAAIDGFTDFARAALLERHDELMGSDLDHYWPVEFGFASDWTFELTDAAGATRTTTLAPISFAAWSALSGDGKNIDFRTGTTLAIVNDTTARFTIRSFANYRRPISADSLYASTFAQLRRRGVKHLILDLRDNGGGSDDASNGLVKYLIDRPLQPTKAVRRRTILIDSTLSTALDTWGNRTAIFAPAESLFTRRADGWFAERSAVGVIQPSRDAFTGRVSVLVGRHNGSGATMLLAVLQEMGVRTGKLRLVGEETGGSAAGPTAGQILSLKLPNSGMRVRIPLERSDVNVSNPLFGMGAFPDVDGTQTIGDFRARIDRALVTARTTPWTPVRSPLAPTVGLMQGELEYRDYSDSSHRTIPSWSHMSPIGTTGAFRQRTVYDDGPGNTIYTTDVLHIVGNRWMEGDGAESGETGTPESTFRITSRRRTATGQQLVLLGKGMDDNKTVDFRFTVTLGDTIFNRVKEFRLPGQEYVWRHEYRYRRVAVK